jgi:hypothetical protein
MATPEYYHLIKKARGSYIYVFKAFLAKAEKDPKKARFQATCLLHKKDNAADIKIIQGYHDTLEKSLKLGTNKKGNPVKLAEDKTCWHDEAFNENSEYGEEFWTLKVSSIKRPGVFDSDGTPLVEEDRRPYSGCYISTGINLKAWDNDFGKRISGYFNNIMFVKDGEPLGSAGMSGEEEFGFAGGSKRDGSGDDEEDDDDCV